MRNFRLLLFLGGGGVLIGVGQILVINAFPFPFNRLQIAWAVSFLVMLLSSQPLRWWMLIPVVWILEIFSTVPFGIISVSFLASVGLCHWWLSKIFTAQALYSIFFSGLVGIFLYRVLFIILLATSASLTNDNISKKVVRLLAFSFWEGLLTAFIMSIIFLLLTLMNIRFNPRYVTKTHG